MIALAPGAVGFAALISSPTGPRRLTGRLGRPPDESSGVVSMTDLAREVDSFARLYDDVLDNPKLANLGPLGFALYCAGLVYCHRNNTDGFIPHGRVAGLLDWSGIEVGSKNPAGIPGRPRSVGGEEASPWPVAEALVTAGLWHVSSGGYTVHDYLEHNASRAERLAAREAKARAGRLGAASRWGVNGNRHDIRDNNRHGNRHSTRDGTTDGERMANTWQRKKEEDKTDSQSKALTVSSLPLLAETESPRRDRITKATVVRFIFETWRQAANKTDATLLTEARRRVIGQWIGQYPVRDLLDAAIGWKFSSFHRGENDRHKPFNDLELIFRNARTVEQFRDFARDANAPLTGADEWLAEQRQRASEMTIDVEETE